MKDLIKFLALNGAFKGCLYLLLAFVVSCIHIFGRSLLYIGGYLTETVYGKADDFLKSKFKVKLL